MLALAGSGFSSMTVKVELESKGMWPAKRLKNSAKPVLPKCRFGAIVAAVFDPPRGTTMEKPHPMRDMFSSQDGSKAVSYNSQLLDVIISRLKLISDKNKERVLEYIQGLVDMEERQLEFDRRQGRLYRWPADDARV